MTRIIFDVTYSFENYGRKAVGILRAQREICKAILEQEVEVEFFIFNKSFNDFLVIDKKIVENVSGLNDSGHDIREDALREIKTVRLRDGDIVISSGFLWDNNYIDIIKKMKRMIDVKLYTIIYDIIPIILPEYFHQTTCETFRKHIVEVSHVSDAVYCISDSARDDLIKFLADNDLPQPEMRRIILGGNVISEVVREKVISSIGEQVKPGGFVLCVCTLEPRKNHITLFNAWRRLYHTNKQNLPTLIVVGRRGWNSDDLIRMMSYCHYLRDDYLKVFTDIDDEMLSWLYGNCLFSVFPSHYEGWGLPVAESLSYGKFCISSNSSSMSEVSAGLTELIDPLDQMEWIRCIDYYITHRDEIKKKEDLIKSSYKPIEWKESMDEFIKSF